jgi:hypothetical protein
VGEVLADFEGLCCTKFMGDELADFEGLDLTEFMGGGLADLKEGIDTGE